MAHNMRIQLAQLIDEELCVLQQSNGTMITLNHASSTSVIVLLHAIAESFRDQELTQMTQPMLMGRIATQLWSLGNRHMRNACVLRVAVGFLCEL